MFQKYSKWVRRQRDTTHCDISKLCEHYGTLLFGDTPVTSLASMCVLLSVSGIIGQPCIPHVEEGFLIWIYLYIYMFVLPHECVDDISLFEVFYQKCESTMSESIDVAARWTD